MKESLKRLQESFKKIIYSSVIGAFLFGFISSDLINILLISDNSIEIALSGLLLICSVSSIIIVLNGVKYALQEQFALESEYVDFVVESKKIFKNLLKQNEMFHN